jgi:hypothetical protein
MAVPLTKFQSIFTRQVGSIDIRGFLMSLPNPMPYQGMYSCGLGAPRFQAEVSTPHMVGIVDGLGYQESLASPIVYSQPAVIGQPEGDPTLVVLVYTSSNVAQVKMQFAGGSSDQMAPVQGWSALASPTAGGTTSADTVYGTLTAYDHAGKALQQVSVQPAAKPLPAGVPGSGGSGAGVPGSAGSGSAGSGSAGSGSVGSGSVGSGTVHAAGGGVASPPATTSTSPSSKTPPPTSQPQRNIAYPCVGAPAPLPAPTCTPTTTTRSATYACATLLPAQECSRVAGASNPTCVPLQTVPPNTNTATFPNSGSGG